MLDRYERLIEATRLAGREQEAFDLFRYGMGGYRHLGWVLGDYQRGHRILAAFSATGRPEDLGPTMMSQDRSVLANASSFFSHKLGRLAEAWAIRQVDNGWMKSLGERDRASFGLQSSSAVAFARGRLTESRVLASTALSEAEAARDGRARIVSLTHRATAARALGDIPAARADFSSATGLAGKPLFSLAGSQYAHHHLDLGDLAAARALCERGIEVACSTGRKDEVPRFHALLARIDLAESGVPTPHLDRVRDWTARTGEMRYIIECHLLTACHLLARGDPQSALGEAEAGLLHAVSCGYGLLRIELLVAMARVRLAWPDPPRAIQAAREALDLAAHPDCRYAWGEADAAQAWGEAYLANHEPTFAKRAFTRALAIRQGIEHPGIAETERWLARAG